MVKHSLLDVLIILNGIQNNHRSYFENSSTWYVFAGEDASAYAILSYIVQLQQRVDMGHGEGNVT